jgi:hypothetical protein
MKKTLLSFSLIILSVFGFCQTVDIQANAGATGATALGGNTANFVSENLYRESEIGASNFTTVSTAINTIGFNVLTLGANTTYNNVKIYLQEVASPAPFFVTGVYSNAAYTQVFGGAMGGSITVSATGWVEIPISNFVRTTGNDLLVLIERADGVTHNGFTWGRSLGVTDTSAALSCRRQITAFTSGVTSLTASNFRNQIRFKHLNPIDADVSQIFTLGKLPVINGAPHTVTAKITNNGATLLSSLPVTLNITGSNTFTDLQTVASLAPGASTTVTFLSYSPIVIGTNTLTVSVPADDDNTNNSKTATQLVNNNTWSYAQGNVSTGTAGTNGNTIDLVQKFSNTTATSLAQVMAYFTTAGQPYKLGVWDATGAGGTPGNLLYETGIQISTVGVNTGAIIPALALPVGNFYVGARQTGTTNFGLSRQTENPTRTSTFYFALPSGSSTWVDNSTGSTNVFMLEPKLQLPIDAFVSNIVIPNNGGITCTTSSETISVKLTNTGSSTIATGAATVTLKITGANTQTLTTNNLTNLVSGGNEIINFTGVNLSNAGTNNDTVYVNLAGDTEQANDTTKTVAFTTTLGTVALETVPNTYSLTANCDDMGWTYYSDASNKNVLAVEWGANTAAKGAATATLTLDAADYAATAGAGSTATATFTMKRYWNIATTVQPMTPVNVRFFYDAVEKNVTDAAALAYQTANTGSGLETPRWFKTTSGSFVGDGAHVSDLEVLNSIALTDVNTGATAIDGVLYAQFNGITSFSGGGYATGVGSGLVLPVGIQYIKGTKQSSGHLIDWKVSCTAGILLTLTLERSKDGIIFSGIQEQSANYIRCLQPFSYVDASPLAAANYYRIKVTTVDGTIKYSTIVVLLNKEKGFELISVAPNPVKDNALLTITTAKAGKMDIIISDITGKIIQKQFNILVAGNNSINLNVDNIEAGSYSISAVNAEGEKKTIRFVKL